MRLNARLQLENPVGTVSSNDEEMTKNGGGTCRCLHLVDDLATRWLGRLGHLVGSRPGYFVLVPPLVFCVFLTSFQILARSAAANDVQEFLPRGRRSERDREALFATFPVAPASPFPGQERLPSSTYRGEVIFKARDGGTVLRSAVWTEILAVDKLVREFPLVVVDDSSGGRQRFTYDPDLCAKAPSGKCARSAFFGLGDLIPGVEAGQVTLTYPNFIHPGTGQVLHLTEDFGRPMLGGDGRIVNGTVESVKAIYFLEYVVVDATGRFKAWERRFGELVSKFPSNTTDILWYTRTEDESEGERTSNSAVPLISISVAFVFAYSTLAALSLDWVRSKPLVTLLGLVSTCMGTATGFGICLYLGFRFSTINFAAPFLMLGIGVDNAFVVLSAWRRTSLLDPIPERMKETYKEAAVSLTITSLTDSLTYWIGSSSPFPAVTTFCLYAGTSVLSLYVFQLTFFGGVLALSGYLEAGNRHCVTTLKIPAKSEAHSRSLVFQLLCTGGVNRKDPKNPEDDGELVLDRFFGDTVARWLCMPIVRVFAIMLFMAYLVGAAYGIMNLDVGLDRSSVVGVGTRIWKFFKEDDRLYGDHPYKIQIVIPDPFNYSQLDNRKKVYGLMREIEDHPFIAGGNFTVFWLRSFLKEANKSADSSNPPDISTEAKFVEQLKKFLAEPANAMFNFDVQLSPTSPAILASRFLVQAAHLRKSYDGATLMRDLRVICDAAPFKVFPYFERDDLYEQALQVVPMMLQDSAISVAVMLLVSLLMIPDPVSSLWVMVAIASIETGVVGYMSLWGVRLDPVSVISCLLCIGYAVEFATHVSHSYVSSSGETGVAKTRDALDHVGAPIIQGAISTILAALPLGFGSSYLFATFFKITCLVTAFGVLHGLILLPILLSIFDFSAVCGKGCIVTLEKPPSREESVAKAKARLVAKAKEHSAGGAAGQKMDKGDQQIPEQGPTTSGNILRIFHRQSSSAANPLQRTSNNEKYTDRRSEASESRLFVPRAHSSRF